MIVVSVSQEGPRTGAVEASKPLSAGCAPDSVDVSPDPEYNLETAARFSGPSGGPGACGWLLTAKTLLTVNSEREKFTVFQHFSWRTKQ